MVNKTGYAQNPPFPQLHLVDELKKKIRCIVLVKADSPSAPVPVAEQVFHLDPARASASNPDELLQALRWALPDSAK